MIKMQATKIIRTKDDKKTIKTKSYFSKKPKIIKNKYKNKNKNIRTTTYWLHGKIPVLF